MKTRLPRTIPSNFSLKIDNNDKITSFEFTKLPCDQALTQLPQFLKYIIGKDTKEILSMSYSKALSDLSIKNEEEEFSVYTEWTALQSAVSQFLNVEIEGVDQDRCLIETVVQREDGVEVSGILLPPKI